MQVGCDCLGLVRGVWRALYGGEPEPYQPVRSEDWFLMDPQGLHAAAERHLIPVEDARPGAVALIATQRRHDTITHCGILTEKGTMVHAYNSPSAGFLAVVEMGFSGPWERRTKSYWIFP